jgi:ATP-binding cassette subfamily C protein
LSSSTTKNSIPPISVRTEYDWRYVLNIALSHRKQLFTANLIAILAVVASVPVPLLMPVLVDEVLLNKPAAAVGMMNRLFPEIWHGPFLYIFAVLFLTLLLRLTAMVFNVLQSRQFSIIAKEITFRIRTNLLQQLKRISMAEYETVGSGTVASHFVTDLETVDSFIGTTISRFLVAVLTIIGTAIILLWMHWQIALFILFLNPLVIYFTTILGKRVKELKKNENKAFALFQQSLTETLDAIHQIRASNREKHYIHDLIELARDIKKHSAHYAWKSEVASRLSFMVFLFGFDIFRAIAMLMVVYSGLSVGQMFAVFGYLWFMMSPVQEILAIQYSYFSAKAALSRVNHLMALEEEPHYPALENPFTNKETVSIQIQDIHFAYGDDQDVLNGVTLDIKAGEKVAFVGASGGGKSTLVQVLLGLYPAKKGSVCYDNAPITRIGLEVVREHVATVLQSPVLFNGSIRGNLSMGHKYNDKQLWEALTIAQLEETVHKQKEGLDTVVGRQGIRLSGGQRQRLAIARMLLTDPKVVILDEATSALDSETEYQLHEALNNFLENRTTLIIAHRLSAIKQANRVYVFEDGMINEQGEHSELLVQKGLYSKLYGERQH